jgi:hypothetical protein
VIRVEIVGLGGWVSLLLVLASLTIAFFAIYHMGRGDERWEQTKREWAEFDEEHP